MGIGRLKHGLYYLVRTPSFLAKPDLFFIFSCNSNHGLSTHLVKYNVSACPNNGINIWHKRLVTCMYLDYFSCLLSPKKSVQALLYLSTVQANPEFLSFYWSHYVPSFLLSPSYGHLGPYRTLTQDGAKYFLTVVNDFSRCTWVFFMHLNRIPFKSWSNFLDFCILIFKIMFRPLEVRRGGGFSSGLDWQRFGFFQTWLYNFFPVIWYCSPKFFSLYDTRKWFSRT